MWTYNAQLVKAIDGDTFDAMVDLGFGVQMKLRMRLDGVDAPERSDRVRWAKARAALHTFLTDAGTFQVQTRRIEKYGRWLATVTWNGGESDLAEHLLHHKLAVAWDGQGAHPSQAELLAI